MVFLFSSGGYRLADRLAGTAPVAPRNPISGHLRIMDRKTILTACYATLGAWLLPGLGHILLGQVRRGVILLSTILAVWVGGLLIGGVTVIDHRNHDNPRRPNLAFLGQALIAPSLVVNLVHHKLEAGATGRILPSNERLRYVPAHGRSREQGVLFTALAGLLNVLAIIDVMTITLTGHAHRIEDEPEAEGIVNS